MIAPLDGGQLLALESANGREVWRRSLGGPVRVQPSFGGSRLFVPIDDGRLAALEVTTGRVLWEQPLTGSPRTLSVCHSRSGGDLRDLLQRSEVTLPF